MSVTDGDRERAAELLRGGYRQEAIAGALAEERERARAPFLELADVMFHAWEIGPHARDRIRRAAEEA